jgi:hypothetical protein
MLLSQLEALLSPSELAKKTRSFLAFEFESAIEPFSFQTSDALRVVAVAAFHGALSPQFLLDSGG